MQDPDVDLFTDVELEQRGLESLTVTDRMPLRRAAASSTSPRATASATGSAGGSQVPRPAT
ncbi:hypothetical protein [[Kitasatospora] papulosa]|uniref:hypothetical protein n=1 Tax=[Kitasatospora] papulosa TaxID=1464011 RepID=UPI00368244A4